MISCSRDWANFKDVKSKAVMSLWARAGASVVGVPYFTEALSFHKKQYSVDRVVWLRMRDLQAQPHE